MTISPCFPRHAGEAAWFDHERFTRAWILAQNALRSVVKEPAGEPSLSGEPECLSLQAQYSTRVQNSQEKKGGARMECYGRGNSFPCLKAGNSLPHPVEYGEHVCAGEWCTAWS